MVPEDQHVAVGRSLFCAEPDKVGQHIFIRHADRIFFFFQKGDAIPADGPALLLSCTDYGIAPAFAAARLDQYIDL